MEGQMFITNEYFLTSEIAYRQERLARDWATANARRTKRPVRRRPRRALLRLPGQRTGTVTPA
jgi:hypothetical protein